MNKLLLTLFVVGFVMSSNCFGQPLSLDLTFSGDGMTTTNIGYFDYGRSVAVQSDGKILLAGYSSATGSGDYNFAIVRFNVNGTLDNTFGTGGKVLTDFGTLNYDGAQVVVVQSDGKILAGGVSYNVPTSSFAFALARYNTNGTLDASFDTDGKVTTVVGANEDGIRDIVLQSDGKIVVVGYTTNGTNDNSVIARYNSNGSLDNTFGTNGITITAVTAFDDWFLGTTLQTDGKIIAVGYDLDASSNMEMTLVRYNTNGTLDNTFGTSGIVITNFGSNDDFFRAVAVQTDGKIVAAGTTFNSTQPVFAVARFNTNGTFDNTFNSTGRVTTAFGSINDQGQDLALQSDGKIVVGGFSSNGTDLDFAACRYNTNGTLDLGFDGDGKLTTNVTPFDDYCFSIAISPTDGKIVLGGHNVYSGSGEEFAVVRYCPKASQPGIISGNATSCNGSTETYTITAVAGADDYTWTVPPGATINSGQGTNSISVTFGSTSGNITVTADNGCGTSPVQTKSISIPSIPSTPGTISGAASICEGTTQTYSISSVSGATGYTWTVPVGTTINSGQGTNSISVTLGYASGNIEVTAYNSCGTSSANSFPLTVTPLPYSFFGWSSTGLAVTFTNLSLNGTTYAWAFGDAGTSAAPSPVHNYGADGTYTVELTVTNACGTGYYTTNITISSTSNGGNVGINEIENELLLNSYPNPTSGIFQLVVGDEINQTSQDYMVEVFNLMGECVRTFNLEASQAEINLVDFANGIYFLKCNSEKGKGMIKIIKQ